MIINTLVLNLVQPKNKQKQCQIRQVCSSALIEIIGRHKQFSSGDQLLEYLLHYCGELLIIYSKIQSAQICRFLIGMMTKATQKIYDPQLDKKINIFRISQKHQKLLQGYLPLRLHICYKTQNAAPEAQIQKIRQQDGKHVIKLNRHILQYLTLVAVTLQNQIDQFLLNNNILNFAWECMRKHPKNDILLVQIDKIYKYVISNQSKIKQQLRKELIDNFKIFDKLFEIFQDKQEERLLRPHLFQIWHQLTKWVPKQIKQCNQNWKNLCESYQALIPFYTKTAGLNYNRPTNVKIVVDQQQGAAKSQNQSFKDQNSSQSSLTQEPFFQTPTIISKPEQKNQQQPQQKQKQQQKSADLAQFQAQIAHKKQKQETKLNQFNEFDYFFSKSEEKQQNKGNLFAEFSQFG